MLPQHSLVRQSSILLICAAASGLAANSTFTNLQSSLNPSTLGHAITLTATVSPSSAAGKVTFYDGVSILGVSSISGGQAVLTTSLLPSGVRTIRAFYSGSSSFSSSGSGALSQKVTALFEGGRRPPVMYPIGINPTVLVTGDFNGDGFVDLASASFGSKQVSVQLGYGDGAFQAPVNYDVGGNAQCVAAGDFNGDGSMDLAVAVYTGGVLGSVMVLLNNGDGTFQPAVSYSAGTDPRFLAVADFNKDGNADIAVVNGFGPGPSGGGVTVLLGNGDGTFKTGASYPVGTNPTSMAIGDLNLDGNPDLVVTNLDDSTVDLLLGKGDGTFNSALTYPTDSAPVYVVVADLNGDGRPDFAVVCSLGGPANTQPGSIMVFNGNGDGTFQQARTITSYTLPTRPLFIAVGDFNGDGLLDLAVAESSRNQVSLLFNNGDGSFQTPIAAGTVPSPNALVVSDFNGDGLADIAVTSPLGLIANGEVSVIVGTATATVTDGPDLTITKSHSGNFFQGQTGAVYTIQVGNLGLEPSAGTVTVTDTLPAGLTATSMAGPGWTCTLASLSCSRSNPLPVNVHYPAILLIVNVASTAAASITNVAAVSGGGDINLSNNSAADTAAVTVRLAITNGSPLPSGAVGLPYSQVLTASAGVAPLTWSVSAGSLPAGLALSSSGTIGGTPSAAGTSNFTVGVTDATGANASQSFALTIAAVVGPFITQVANGASFANAGLSPGLIFTIKGAGLGPAVGVTSQLDSSGRIATIDSEVQVLVDGVAAPLLFVRQDQINAVAPYALTNRIGQSVGVQVIYKGIAGNLVTVTVVAAAPAIFSLGNGQGAIRNQDQSVNGTDNPAAAGSIVSIYATGEGQTNPPGVDGLLVTDTNTHPAAAVSVTIGGIAAQVQFRGSTVFDGFLQVNVVVPAGLIPGTVPVVLTIGGTPSQAGITMAVK